MENTEQNIEDAKLVANVDIKEIRNLFPKIHDAIIPLSNTGISARNFFHWKKENLIDLPEFSKNDWVRLNIFQYAWLKIVEQLRFFGVSFKAIRSIKEFVFTDALDPVMENSAELIKMLESNKSLSSEQIEASKRIINELKERGGLPQEHKIIATTLGSEITSTLLRGTVASLIIVRKGENDLLANFTSFNSKCEIDALLPIYPNIQIPIKGIIEGFFEEPKNVEIMGKLGLISANEKKVLDALRDNSFKEIIIKRNNGTNKIIIEAIKETDIINEQKIKEIKRILGLNEYSEITLKTRNDKHIYIKSKLKISQEE